jgi:hypothetical protein
MGYQKGQDWLFNDQAHCAAKVDYYSSKDEHTINKP